VKEFFKKAGQIFFWMWVIWFVVSTSWAMFNVLRGDAPYFSGVLYGTLGGFFIGLLVSYIPLRIAHRREIGKAKEEVSVTFQRAKKRVAPLLEKIRAETIQFLTDLSSGMYDEAMARHGRICQLQSYVDAVLSEHFDSGEEKPERSSPANS